MLFADLELRWKGKGHIIPGDQITKACAVMEDVITIPELNAFLVRGTPPFAKISMAYASLLRFAGVQVTDNEVFSAMFGIENIQRDAAVLVQYLVERMMPKEVATGSAQPGNA